MGKGKGPGGEGRWGRLGGVEGADDGVEMYCMRELI